MALIKCPECGKETSDSARLCPHCGYNIKKHIKQVKKKNYPEKTGKISRFFKENKKQVKIIIFVLVVIAVALSGVLYLKNCVPNIKQKTIEDAQKILNERGIKFDLEYTYTDTIEKDIVYGQSINPYMPYNSKDKLVISVSKGKFYTMPEVEGKNINDIKEEIKDLPIVLEYTYTENIEKDIVVKASVAAGKLFYDHSNTVITVSSGMYQAVPNINAMHIDEAKKMLDEIGLRYEIIEDYSPYDEGIVYGYTPDAFGEPTTTTISLKVSKGQGILIPSVKGVSLEYAKGKLEKAGLGYKVEYSYNDMETDSTEAETNKVTDQDIEGRFGEARDVTLTVNNPAIKITNVNFESNYVGGIDTYVTFKNISDKQIAYVEIVMQYFDRMGYPASCSIKNTSVINLQYTGPLNAGASSGRQYWDAVVYNGSVAAVQPKSATITFSDGTKQKLTYPDYGSYWYLNDYYGGDLHN